MIPSPTIDFAKCIITIKMTDHVQINPGYCNCLKFESMGIKIIPATKDKSYYKRNYNIYIDAENVAHDNVLLLVNSRTLTNGKPHKDRYYYLVMHHVVLCSLTAILRYI